MTNRNIPVVNLYGEDGIGIYLTANGDICQRDDCAEHEDGDAVVHVIGHALYTCSGDEAEQAIQREYLARA